LNRKMALSLRFRYGTGMSVFRRPLSVCLAALLIVSGVAVPLVGCGGSKPKVTSRKDPDSKRKARSALSQARDLARANDFEQASEKYSAAFESSGDIEILIEQIDVLIHGGESPLAESVAQKYVDSKPNDMRGKALLADALLAQEKARPALKLAEQMIEQDPDNGSGHEKRGRALLLLNRSDEALESLRKAVSLDGESIRAMLSLGDALAKAGNFNEAALQFRAAYKLSPDDVEVLVALAMAVREQKDLDEAKQYLEKAISLDPKVGAAHYELGILYNRMNDTANAESELAKSVELAPRESRFWYAYGEIFRLQERAPQALEAYRKAVSLEPTHPKAASKLALMLMDQKDFEGAEKVLTVAVRKDGKNAVNYLNLGAVFAAKRKNSQAIEMFQKFLELASPTDPDRKRAKDAINELKRR
jgi:tetratricopeptide (TPR) repeat protein